jgi:hypothetical protein
MNFKLACSLTALCASFAAMADIRIYSTDNNGQPIIFSSNDRYARMDNQHEKNYALVDFARHQFMLVNPRQREALVLDNSSPASPRAGSPLNIEVIAQGNGPNIAGYATRKFTLSANGKQCAVIYGSKQLASLPEMQKLTRALEQLQQRISRMMIGFNPLIDDCTRAKAQTSQTFKTTGTPLRIDNAHGQTQSQVTRIERHAQIPASAYQIPPGFKVTSMKDQMKQIEQQKQQTMEQLKQQMPDMQKMIEQLQQNGEMPDEAVQQLRKMKELLKQRLPK